METGVFVEKAVAGRATTHTGSSGVYPNGTAVFYRPAGTPAQAADDLLCLEYTGACAKLRFDGEGRLWLWANDVYGGDYVYTIDLSTREVLAAGPLDAPDQSSAENMAGEEFTVRREWTLQLNDSWLVVYGRDNAQGGGWWTDTLYLYRYDANGSLVCQYPLYEATGRPDILVMTDAELVGDILYVLYWDEPYINEEGEDFTSIVPLQPVYGVLP